MNVNYYRAFSFYYYYSSEIHTAAAEHTFMARPKRPRTEAVVAPPTTRRRRSRSGPVLGMGVVTSHDDDHDAPENPHLLYNRAIASDDRYATGKSQEKCDSVDDG